MSAFEAIAFDKDGTIFDSERIFAKAFHRACARFGYSMDEALREKMTGLAAEASVAFLQQHLGKQFDADEFVRIWRGEHHQIIVEHGLPLMPGVEELVYRAYEAGYSLALVTSDDYDGTLHDFANYPDIFSCFSVVVTRDDVLQAKPNAEPYMRAAAYLGVNPEDLLVIEDSKIGATAAVNAHTKLVYYPSSSTMDEELAQKAYRVVTNLKDVMQWL